MKTSVDRIKSRAVCLPLDLETVAIAPSRTELARVAAFIRLAEHVVVLAFGRGSGARLFSAAGYLCNQKLNPHGTRRDFVRVNQ